MSKPQDLVQILWMRAGIAKAIVKLKQHQVCDALMNQDIFAG